jgi:hypothetical protein
MSAREIFSATVSVGQSGQLLVDDADAAARLCSG